MVTTDSQDSRPGSPAARTSNPFTGIDLSLRGRVAVVLGAGPGLGQESIRALASAGCTVVAADLIKDIAEATVADVEGDISAAEVDVTSRESLAALFAEVTARVGAPQIVVNVVGVSRASRFQDTTEADWDELTQINLRQQYLALQESAKVLRAPASYVAVASVNGLSAAPGNALYGSAKAGLISLVQSVAVELAAEGIRVNAIAPGIIATPRIRHAFEVTGREEEFRDVVPLGRIGTPEDVAGVVAFLASPLSSYVTGATLAVDGGGSIVTPLNLAAYR